MFKLFKRIIAYLIDIVIITTICQSLANTTILNPNLNKYEKYTKEYNQTYTNYMKYVKQLYTYYQDKELSEKEYQKLIDNNKEYEKLTNKYYKDSKLTEKNYNKLLKELANNYKKSIEEISYYLEKNSISEKVLYILLVFLYFIGFNYITDGQTLGKKIMRLKIENIEGNKKVSITSYIIRVLLMYQTIYYIAKLIGILFLSKSQYNEIISVVYSIQNILDLAIVSVMLFRTNDGRGLHDLLAKTKVVQVKRKKAEE